jgi:SdrD B-like domain
VLATTVTDAVSGRYTFDNLAAGTYKVKFSGLSASNTWTMSLVGSDRATDSDPVVATGVTSSFVLDSTNPNVRSTLPTDLAVFANKIDPTIDAGRAASAAVGASTVCMQPT